MLTGHNKGYTAVLALRRRKKKRPEVRNAQTPRVCRNSCRELSYRPYILNGALSCLKTKGAFDKFTLNHNILRSLGSRKSRKPSPKRFIPKTVSIIAKPGNKVIQ